MSSKIKFAIMLIAASALTYLVVIGGLAICGGATISMVMTAWPTRMYIAIALLLIAGLLLYQVYLMSR